jgi:cell volume regulation protein A
VQGWTIAPAARFLNVALPRADEPPTRVELDLPGQLEQELVGYQVRPTSLYMRSEVIPPWAKLTLVVRNEKVLSPAEAGTIQDADYVYFLAPPEKAQALDRFFVNAPPSAMPDERLLGDFYLSGDATLGALGEIYGLTISPEDKPRTLAEHFQMHVGEQIQVGDSVDVGTIQLIADKVDDGRVSTVGLSLSDEAESMEAAKTLRGRVQMIIDKARGYAGLS